MSEPPEPATLADWVDGRLGFADAARVAARIAAADERTQRTVQWLRRFRRDAAAFPLVDPPPIVRQRLRRHYADWSASRTPRDSALREFDATLLFDSRQDFALAGTRAVDAAGAQINLAFSCEVGDVVLDLTPRRDGTFRLDGQVLLTAATNAPFFAATVDGPGTSLRTVDGEADGRFAFPTVPPTVRRVQVDNGEVRISAIFRPLGT